VNELQLPVPQLNLMAGCSLAVLWEVGCQIGKCAVATMRLLGGQAVLYTAKRLVQQAHWHEAAAEGCCRSQR
jgi:hypothetical protein